ncbi:hypothetical protein [Neorhodopirellula lusitana]|uniref:hypothetical protein n=1 Tax=Neorhodopirellula lusitana TaxID=445327 RepID=UPI0024B87750|nr:hypothetical protein [Neorhodopirellula lusitana]
MGSSDPQKKNAWNIKQWVSHREFIPPDIGWQIWTFSGEIKPASPGIIMKFPDSLDAVNSITGSVQYWASYPAHTKGRFPLRLLAAPQLVNKHAAGAYETGVSFAFAEKSRESVRSVEV